MSSTKNRSLEDLKAALSRANEDLEMTLSHLQTVRANPQAEAWELLEAEQEVVGAEFRKGLILELLQEVEG